MNPRKIDVGAVLKGTLSDLQRVIKSQGYFLESQTDERPLYAKDEEIIHITQKWATLDNKYAEIFIVDSAYGRSCQLTYIPMTPNTVDKIIRG